MAAAPPGCVALPRPLHPRASADSARWLEVGEAPCDDVLESSGADRATWSCILPLHAGPKKKPEDNPGYTTYQLNMFSWFRRAMPQAGHRSSAGLLKRAFQPHQLKRLLAEVSGKPCIPLTPDQNAAWFTQFVSTTGLLPCKLDLGGSDVLKLVEAQTHALLEMWSGVRLERANHNALFKSCIVVYPRGSVVHAHLDRQDKHQISATLIVDTVDLQDGWSMEVAQSNWTTGGYSSAVAVYAQAGDLVAYQGARWEHSRPRPLVGDSFWVIIMHYKVAGWDFP